MTPRPYSRQDEEILVRIWFESWSSVGLPRPVVTQSALAARWPRDLSERWDVTVAECDGEILGFLAIAPQERRLDQLFITPDAQGKGIGRQLFDIAKEKMRHGFWLKTQAANTRARSFYERVGMTLDRFERDPDGGTVVYRFEPGDDI